MTIKERIQEILKERSISSVRLEQDLGFGKGYISKLDKASPSAENILKIADYLNVSIDYIMGKTNSSYVQLEGLSNYTYDPVTGTLILKKNIQNQDPVNFLRTQNMVKLSEDAIDIAAHYSASAPEVQQMIRMLLKYSEHQS